MTRLRIRGFVALVAAGLLLAACGSSTKTGSSTTTTAASVPNTPQQLAADQAITKKTVLRLSDLPAGYKQIPPNPDSNNDFPPAVLAKFRGLPAHLSKQEATEFFAEDRVKQPQAETDFMQRVGDEYLETDLENTVELNRSVQDISKPFVTLKKTPLSCWQGLFEAALAASPPEGATIGAVKVTPLSILGLGDQALAFRVAVDISAPGLALRTTVDVYFVGRGRAGISLTATGVGRVVDPAFERSMLEKVVRTVENELNPPG